MKSSNLPSSGSQTGSSGSGRHGYSLSAVYDKYQEFVKSLGNTRRPNPEVLHDLQIVHEALNDRNTLDIYFKDVNQFIKERIEQLDQTPTRALAGILWDRTDEETYGFRKFPKLFEGTPKAGTDSPELKFLATVRRLKRPYYDVAAGLFHGEYEHPLQIDFMRDLFRYPHLYGTTNLKTKFSDLWDAMYAPEHAILTPEGANLSLWSLVTDIQGGFLTGEPTVGINSLFGGKDQYAGIYGASATLLHYGFGAYKGTREYKQLKEGELAIRFPYLALAIKDRQLKRKKEAKGPGVVPTYLSKYHSQLDKEQRRKEALESTFPEDSKVTWSVKPSTKSHPHTPTDRKNVL